MTHENEEAGGRDGTIYLKLEKTYKSIGSFFFLPYKKKKNKKIKVRGRGKGLCVRVLHFL